MPNYRPAKYGMVSADLLDPSLTAVNDLLKVFLRSAGQDYEFLTSPKSIEEVIGHAKNIMGDDFQAWLAANYEDGSAVRAEIVRRILGYLNGELSGQLVVEAVRLDQNKLRHFKRIGDNPPHTFRRMGKDQDKWRDLLLDVNGNDLFRLIEGIGIDIFAQLLLSFSGEPGDV